MLEFPAKLIKKAQSEAKIASKENMDEKEKRREKARQEIEEREEQFRRETLMSEGATFSKKREIAPQVRSSRTPAGDSLKHGPRGGRIGSGRGLKKLR